MSEDNIERIKRIWANRESIPVIHRRIRQPLLAGFPYSSDNRNWLKGSNRNKPKWDGVKKHWVMPAAWFNELVNKTLERHKKVYVIQPYREQEKCAPACWNADGHECNCSCMGGKHGQKQGGNDWFIISDTFATKWNESELACRLLCAEEN